ncbi:hypothetical protein ACFYWS_20710 [Streptomyces sp. NPDC002795]|uniref:hypothetical protein n=1 Tax=Streptomyces sp. NPDC002795 TaxID=3364665 RepID=UPI003684F1DD
MGTTPNGDLAAVISEHFDLDAESASSAAATVASALHQAWRQTGYGDPYASWMAKLPEPMLACLLAMAARAELDEYSVLHELRIARIAFTEMALGLRTA